MSVMVLLTFLPGLIESSSFWLKGQVAPLWLHISCMCMCNFLSSPVGHYPSFLSGGHLKFVSSYFINPCTIFSVHESVMNTLIFWVNWVAAVADPVKGTPLHLTSCVPIVVSSQKLVDSLVDPVLSLQGWCTCFLVLMQAHKLVTCFEVNLAGAIDPTVSL